VRLWEVATGRQIAELADHAGRVNTVAFAPDGRVLASGERGGGGWRVRLWEVATGRQIAELADHAGAVNAVAFAPDGRVLASGDGASPVGGGRLRLWEVATGRQIAELAGHGGVVHTVAFSPDGRTVASGGMDGTVRLWDVASGTLVATLAGLAGGGWAVLLPDGSYKLAGDPGDSLWWVMNGLRFAPGELDGLDPAVRRLDERVPVPR
jgi:WD40 repeat protein